MDEQPNRLLAWCGRTARWCEESLRSGARDLTLRRYWKSTLTVGAAGLWVGSGSPVPDRLDLVALLALCFMAVLPLRNKSWHMAAVGMMTMAWAVSVSSPDWWSAVAAALGVLLACLMTTRWRFRRDRVLGVLAAAARGGRLTRLDGEEVKVGKRPRWKGRELVRMGVEMPLRWAEHDPAIRRNVAAAVTYELRDMGTYDVLAAGNRLVTVEQTADLPHQLMMGHWRDRKTGKYPEEPVLGATTRRAASVVDATGMPLLTWRWGVEKHCIVCGQNGKGKTVLVRSLIASMEQVENVGPGWILDGKEEGDYVDFDGRGTVRAVANDPGGWMRSLSEAAGYAAVCHSAVLRWRQGKGEKPQLPHAFLVLDELQRIVEQVPQARDVISNLSRTARSANLHLIAVTQRPDVSDVLPGASRDQFGTRVAMGLFSAEGARMIFDEHWRYVAGDPEDPDAETRPGFAMVKMCGRIYQVQVPFLDLVVVDPEAAEHYPAVRDDDGETDVIAPVIQYPGYQMGGARWLRQAAGKTRQGEGRRWT